MLGAGMIVLNGFTSLLFRGFKAPKFISFSIQGMESSSTRASVSRFGWTM